MKWKNWILCILIAGIVLALARSVVTAAGAMEEWGWTVSSILSWLAGAFTAYLTNEEKH